MAASWLHVSDFHFKSGVAYDQDVVLRALVRSVAEFRQNGRQPDLIFASGDVAHSGQESEYQAATKFFDALCAAAGVDRRRLYVVAGNHDTDRVLGVGLARTMETREEADAYFGPNIPKPHITQKQGAFQQWYDQYFDGIRTFPRTSTCGPVEVVQIGGLPIAILPVNSALFCQGDDDHAKLWIGRRCLDTAVEDLRKLGSALKIALIHHPLDWLHEAERSNVRTALQSNVDIILRGHLHETDVEAVAGVMGNVLHMAAGAAYQTRRWPNRALYASIGNGKIEVFPIRYEDNPRELWTVDPSVFPEPPYIRTFSIPKMVPRSPSLSGVHIDENKHDENARISNHSRRRSSGVVESLMLAHSVSHQLKVMLAAMKNAIGVKHLILRDESAKIIGALVDIDEFNLLMKLSEPAFIEGLREEKDDVEDDTVTLEELFKMNHG